MCPSNICLSGAVLTRCELFYFVFGFDLKLVFIFSTNNHKRQYIFRRFCCNKVILYFLTDIKIIFTSLFLLY